VQRAISAVSGGGGDVAAVIVAVSGSGVRVANIAASVAGLPLARVDEKLGGPVWIWRQGALDPAQCAS
jgi:hypothetical protein